jgi:hypothetical protein
MFTLDDQEKKNQYNFEWHNFKHFVQYVVLLKYTFIIFTLRVHIERIFFNSNDKIFSKRENFVMYLLLYFCYAGQDIL